MTRLDLADIGPAIPADFVREIAGRKPEPHIDGDAWLRSLPRLVRECAAQWRLQPDGEVRHGVCAIVIPVLREGAPAALKVMWPHTESDTEHLALRAWNGHGAVRLLAADPSRGALLLERLHADRDLGGVDLLEACEVVGGLCRQLDRPAPPQVRTLDELAVRWADQLRVGSAQVPRRMTAQAAAYLTTLTAGSARRLVHSDLHFANVLAADRAPWLAIDPKPVAAPWEFAVAPVLWNRSAETMAAHSPRTHLRLRLGIVCDAAGLDEQIAARWSFVRVVLNALWAAPDGTGTGADTDTGEFISRMLVVAKAMSD